MQVITAADLYRGATEFEACIDQEHFNSHSGAYLKLVFDDFWAIRPATDQTITYFNAKVGKVFDLEIVEPPSALPFKDRA